MVAKKVGAGRRRNMGPCGDPSIRWVRYKGVAAGFVIALEFYAKEPAIDRGYARE